jgi:DnaD/phage-associated family protein
MYHRFNVEVATRYGVPCALVLGHIDYLVEKARADGEKKRNGKFWVSKSVKKIAELYPYYTEKQVRSAIDRLRTEGLVATGHFPTSECPSTLWYTLTKKGKTLLTRGDSDLPPRANQFDPQGETICPEGQNEAPPRANQFDPQGETSTKELIDPLIDSLVDEVNSHHHQEDIDINPFGDDNDDDFRPNFNTIFTYASANLRSLTGGNIERLQSFIDDLPEDLIRYAIDKACGLGHPFFGYVQPILQQYVEMGFKTVAEVEAYEAERKRRKGGTNGGEHRRDSSAAPQRIGGETIV